MKKILLGGAKVFGFSPGLSTFTPSMAKRTAPGPFDAAPICQGDFDGSGVCDLLKYGRGSAVFAGAFYDVFDGYQGSITFWWTPEKDRDATQTIDEWLLLIAPLIYITYEHDNQRFRFQYDTQSCYATLASVAGTTYLITLRWDVNNDLDGTNYLCVSINDTHAFGGAVQPSAVTPVTETFIGSYSTTVVPANAIIEGTTVYRRCLWDGAQGVDAGNGDEINLIWAAGAGVKPEEITGGDDICFQLPTNGTAEALVTGTGEAWHFPWVDNELTNWHLQEDTAGAPDDWVAVNAPVLADAATADILFDTRSQKISVDAALEGIRGDTAPAALEDKVVWAWVKTGGAGQGVDLRIYDNDNAANIVEMTTDATAWTRFNTCYKVPVGCTDVQHFIESTDAAAYDMHVGQVQVLPNLVDNGGMEGTYVDESGVGIGTVDVAPGWANSGCETDGTDELSEEGAIVHSGGASQKAIVDAADEGIITDATCFTANAWHLVTVWLYGDTTVDINIKDVGGTFLDETVSNVPAAWTRYTFVTYATAADKLIIDSASAGTFYVDDVSIIELNDVTLTCTPADADNSAEGTGIRVDGFDTLTQPIPAGLLLPTSGTVQFHWTPRHGDGDFEKFFVDPGPVEVVQIYFDANNRIILFSNASDALWFDCYVGGVNDAQNYAAAAITAGTKHKIKISYDAVSAYLYVDNVLVATSSPAGGINFGASVPTTAYWGTNAAGEDQVDAVYG